MNKCLEHDTEPVAAGIAGARQADAARGTVSGVNSLVGSTVRIAGQVFCRQDLFVDGEIDGTMELPDHKLTVGPQANVKADIKAQNVVVRGNAEGKLEISERVELRSGCHLVGDIKTARIVIEDGAYFKGTVEVVREMPA